MRLIPISENFARRDENNNFWGIYTRYHDRIDIEDRWKDEQGFSVDKGMANLMEDEYQKMKKAATDHMGMFTVDADSSEATQQAAKHQGFEINHQDRLELEAAK